VRLIKLAFLSILFFFLFFTVIGMFFPSRIRISRATNIAADGRPVFAPIDDRTQWKTWHPWFRDTARAAPLGFEWMEKTDSTRALRLTSEGIRPLENHFQVHRFGGADSLTLQWYIDFHLRWYPWERFGSLFYENQYGPVLEKGLQDLKGLSHGDRR
jgi:hypothetical protein